ncbi:hypothetical protein SAMN04489747_0622 [Auraticoccus monumenti]|uniref:Glyoxalase-related protein domain-containing protein n=1 Tax=Auraticoccus monumenti TaxID=675864 RepID=A0A1G6THJ2_9ACTN|nr:glyoxalase superfamily protein [Auraticoccus monumenti]SDD28632.1 hypothetical protein SAMN04489747_0622 [Auraticoccus monumenti]
MIPLTPDAAKDAARALRSALEPHVALSHGQALDVLARALGLSDWNALAATYRAPDLGIPMPVLRVQDAALARGFYVDWLGFTVDFEHRFEPDSPSSSGSAAARRPSGSASTTATGHPAASSGSPPVGWTPTGSGSSPTRSPPSAPASTTTPPAARR